MRPFSLLSAKRAGIEGAGEDATGLLSAERGAVEGAGGIATGAFCAMTDAVCLVAWVPDLPKEIVYPKTPSVSSRQAPGMSNRPSPGAAAPPPMLLRGICSAPDSVISSVWEDESGMAKPGKLDAAARIAGGIAPPCASWPMILGIA